MRRAPRIALAVLAALALGACGTRGSASSSAAGGSASTTSAVTSSASAVPSPAVTVSPGSGSPTSVFTVRFVAPASAGPAGQTRIAYTVSVTGGQASGCLGAASAQAGAATQGLATSVALDPVRLGSRWCPGVHRVRVVETGGPVCQPGTMCPQYVRVIGTVGTARFSVSG